MEEFTGDDLHLRDYLNIVRKRQWSVLAVFVVIATIGTIRTFRATPVYQANAQILIEKDNPNILSFDEIMELDGAKSDYYQTQYRILKSRSLASKVIDQLALYADAKVPPPPTKGMISGVVSFFSIRQPNTRACIGVSSVIRSITP